MDVYHYTTIPSPPPHGVQTPSHNAISATLHGLPNITTPHGPKINQCINQTHPTRARSRPASCVQQSIQQLTAPSIPSPHSPPTASASSTLKSGYQYVPRNTPCFSPTREPRREIRGSGGLVVRKRSACAHLVSAFRTRGRKEGRKVGVSSLLQRYRRILHSAVDRSTRPRHGATSLHRRPHLSPPCTERCDYNWDIVTQHTTPHHTHRYNTLQRANHPQAKKHQRHSTQPRMAG
jgi:hypothetical protein